MHPTMKRAFSIALTALATLAPAWAIAEGDVTVALTAHRVIQKDGRETLGPGEQAAPGEVLEYHATYRNAGNAQVRRLAATLPIPRGMELLAGTAEPRGVTGSLDGRWFDPLPLKRRVRLADGREVVREVPASEIRWLRWAIPALSAGAEKSVRARVRVTPVPMAAAVRR